MQLLALDTSPRHAAALFGSLIQQLCCGEPQRGHLDKRVWSYGFLFAPHGRNARVYLFLPAAEHLLSGVRPYAVDPDHAKALWAKSEAMVGERF